MANGWGGKRNPPGGRPKGLAYQRTLRRRVAETKALRMEDITAERTMREIARVGFSDYRQLFDKDGKLRPITELSPDIRAAVASAKLTKKNLTAGDGVQEDVVEVKLWDKVRALELLAKHFALTQEVVHVVDDVAMLDRLDKVKERNRLAKETAMSQALDVSSQPTRQLEERPASQGTEGPSDFETGSRDS